MNNENLYGVCAGCGENEELDLEGFCTFCAEILEETCVGLEEINQDWEENLSFELGE